MLDNIFLTGKLIGVLKVWLDLLEQATWCYFKIIRVKKQFYMDGGPIYALAPILTKYGSLVHKPSKYGNPAK